MDDPVFFLSVVGEEDRNKNQLGRFVPNETKERKMTQSPQGARPADNLRVRRTKLLLREALIELIEERGFESLTIGELTERAMVSRAAFYRNYQDKYDLVEQIFEEAMSALLNAVGELGREHPPKIWVTFFEHIAQYERLYRALLGSSGSPWFVRKMRASLADIVVTVHEPVSSRQPTAE